MRPITARFTGRIQLAGPVDRVFELFSPIGERQWVPGWDPELLHPPDVEWAEGLIFRTREEMGDAIWVVTRLDRDGHSVEYHRVEPARYVARVRIRCEPRSERETKVETSYAFVGLSAEGNAEITVMTAGDYQGKMERWRRWIDASLSRRDRRGGGRSDRR